MDRWTALAIVAALAATIGCAEDGSGGGGGGGAQGGNVAAGNSVEGLFLTSLPGVAENLDVEYYDYSNPADADSNPSVLTAEERMPAENGSGDRTVICIRAQVPGPGFTDTGSLVPASEGDIFDLRLFGRENPTLIDPNPPGYPSDCQQLLYTTSRRLYILAEVETSGGSQIEGPEVLDNIEPSDAANNNTTELELVVCDDTITVLNLPFQHSHFALPQVGWPVGWQVGSLTGQPLTVDRVGLEPVIDPTPPPRPGDPPDNPTTDDFTNYATCGEVGAVGP